MNRHFIAPVLSALLVCVTFGAAPGVSAQTGGNYKVNASWALTAGTKWDGLTMGIAANRKGQIAVLVRTAPYFRVFTRDGVFVKAFGDDGLFKGAHSVTFDAQGAMWVTNIDTHVVEKFTSEGLLLMTLGKKGVAGDNTSRDMFNRPNHVAFAPNGDIYVSDGYENARVVQFTKEGQFVRIIGGVKGSQPGQLQLPHGVALDSKGRILVNDSDNKRVSVFDKDGTFVEVWPYASRGGIIVTADDTAYISDVNAGAVNIVKNGKLIDKVSVEWPHGMDIDTDGSIYIAGASKMSVSKITKGR